VGTIILPADDLPSAFKTKSMLNNVHVHGSYASRSSLPVKIREASRRASFLITAVIVLLTPIARAASTNADTVTIKSKPGGDTGVIAVPRGDSFSRAFKNGGEDEFYAKGEIDGPDTLRNLINVVQNAATGIANVDKIDAKRTYFVHVSRNEGPGSKSSYNKWYIYDPQEPKNRYYIQTDEQAITRTVIGGRSDFTLVSLHIRYAEPRTPAAAKPDKFPVKYVISIKKEKTQFAQDLEKLLTMVDAPAFVKNLAGLAGVKEPFIYAITTDFSSPYETSSIGIAAGIAAASGDDSEALSSTINYRNEAPTWYGLSFAVPVTSYKDVTFDKASSVLTPKTITRQSVYANIDLYFPKVLPGLTQARYIPHLFAGIPIKGKVMKHPMIGVGVGFKYLEPFAGIVYDMENQASNGSHDPVFKALFGIKVSVSAVSDALKK
jgi:hypothetical protein